MLNAVEPVIWSPERGGGALKRELQEIKLLPEANSRAGASSAYPLGAESMHASRRVSPSSQELDEPRDPTLNALAMIVL